MRGCIKAQGKGTLQGTVEACLTADPDQKVQGKRDKVAALFAPDGVCAAHAGTDLVTDATTINSAHVSEPIALAHDIFGANLDGGQLLQSAAESKCQDGIAHRAAQMFDAWAKQFRTCKKAAMKNGAASEAAVVSACLNELAVRGTGSGLDDPAGKVSSKGNKLTATRSTTARPSTLTLAPGACVGGGVQGDFKPAQDLVGAAPARRSGRRRPRHRFRRDETT